jgi:hypothetical protein
LRAGRELRAILPPKFRRETGDLSHDQTHFASMWEAAEPLIEVATAIQAMEPR